MRAVGVWGARPEASRAADVCSVTAVASERRFRSGLGLERQCPSVVADIDLRAKRSVKGRHVVGCCPWWAGRHGIGGVTAAHREADGPFRPTHCHASGAGVSLPVCCCVQKKRWIAPTASRPQSIEVFRVGSRGDDKEVENPCCRGTSFLFYPSRWEAL